MANDLQKFVGHLYKFRMGENLYQFVIGTTDNKTHPCLIVEQIGGHNHGMLTQYNQFDFLHKYQLVS